MVVSTIFDKDLKQKVFQVRDSERYTNSTLTSLSLTTGANIRSYLQLNLTATVQKHLGQASIAFYDGDVLLGVKACNQGTSTITFTAKVAYGYHKIWAKYSGNAECLSSKSGIVEVDVAEPNLVHTAFIEIEPENYFFLDSLDTQALTGRLRNIDNLTNISGARVNIYIDGELAGHTTTSGNGGFSYTIVSPGSTPSYSIGEHTVKYEYEGTSTYFECEAEAKFNIVEHEYFVIPSTKYNKVGVGEEIEIDVVLSDYTLEPVVNETVRLKED